MASVKVNYGKNGEIISYRLRADLGRDPNGKQVIQTKTIKSTGKQTPAKELKAMQREADQWENALRDGLAPMGKATFEQVVSDFETIHGPNLKASTLSFYKNMKKLPLEYFGRKEFATIRAIDIEKFLLFLREVKKDDGEPLAPKTVKHIFAYLKVLFSFAEKHDIITINPIRKVATPTVPAKKVQFLDEGAAKKFLAELDTAPLRWKAIMSTLLLTGLRRGELCGLQWSDIDFAAGTMNVERNATYISGQGVIIGTLKTANSARTLPIPANLSALLKQWQAEQARPHGAALMPSAYVFAVPENPFDPAMPDTVTRWLSRFCADRGLPPFSPHTLRHSCASLLLISGATVKDTQLYLGHSDPSTTLKYYTGSNDDRLKKAGDGLATALNF